MRGKLITAIVAAGLASSAYAGDYSVSFNASDLNSFAGVKSVHAQFEETAKDYCPTYSQIRSLADVRKCRDDVVADLVSRTDNPRLTAFHLGETVEQVAQR